MNKSLIGSTLVAVSVAVAASALSGCASSNASRASRDSARSLTLGDMRGAAKTLVRDIAVSPKFMRYREAQTKQNGEIVILLQGFKNQTDDPSISNSQSSFFNALEENCLEHDMTFRQDLDPGLPNYTKGIEEFDKQDSDDRYNQEGSGDITTGMASKAVLGLQVVIEKERSATAGGGNLYEYVLRTKLIDGRNKTSLLSKSFPITKESK